MNITPLQFTSFEEEQVNVLLRDLGDSENLNVMVLLRSHQDKNKVFSNKKTKKSQQIISNNNEKRNSYSLSRDRERLDYFNNVNTFTENLLNEIPNFNTNWGKQRMKLKLLKLAYKDKNYKHIINLFLQILSDKYEDKYEEKLVKKVTKFMSDIDYKTMQFEKLYNDLYPLDFYNEYEKKLDPWQLKVLTLIDDNKSVLVTAPTSCGKTWLAVYPGIKGKKILFIVPTDALVFQVASVFTKFIHSVPTIITSEISLNNNSNIVVGTAKYIEDKLYLLDLNFECIVFDEIHNLNHDRLSQYYERLLKIFSNTQILALSATLKSPENLIQWINQFSSKKFEIVKHNTRFLNLQRHIFSNKKLIRIHPISCIDENKINSSFLNSNLPMTPLDCVELFNSLSKVFPEEMEPYSVSKFFPEHNRRLSLHDSRIYEDALKTKLIDLYNTYPDEIKHILDEFKVDVTSEEPNLYSLFKEIKKNNLIPCIVFQENTNYCKDVFTTLVNYLEKLENLNYPFYYDNLEFRMSAFKKMTQELEKFRSTIKLSQDVVNPQEVIEQRENNKVKELTNAFIEDFKKLHEKQIISINNSKETEKVKKNQIHNLKKELELFIKNPKLRYIDIYQKHKDFCMNYDNPMSADQIRNIKKIISKSLNIDVSYTNVFLQGLKRGIGIYTKHMPYIYNMIVQKYAQKGDLGVVIADDTLALGINMPFRSSCILGYKDSVKFKKDNYLQMIGRAGRRGKDREGSVIFANVDWKCLLQSELTDIQSPYVNLKNYRVIEKLNSTFSNESNDQFKDVLDKIHSYSMTEINDNEFETIFYEDSTLNLILWKIREYNNTKTFCNQIQNIDVNLRKNPNFETIKYVIGIICRIILENEDNNKILIKVLQNQKINDESYNHYEILKEFLRIVKEIHNVLLINNSYKFLQQHLHYTFVNLNRVMINSCDLN